MRCAFNEIEILKTLNNAYRNELRELTVYFIIILIFMDIFL